MSDGYWYPPRPPRRQATDGVASRSRRGDIGSTWWSRKFVDALERICEPKRLTRGRSYARSGQVAGLDVDDGHATAAVQGSRRRPYQVLLEIDPFDDEQWDAVEEAMSEQAIFLASLLAGEMPDDIETAFARAGLSLFPVRPDELRSACSCPDQANPCKHVAATLYILAERFDEDPFEIFLWRGRSKVELIQQLRERRKVGRAEAGRPAVDDASIANPLVPLAASIDDFWGMGGEIRSFPLAPHAPAVPDAVLRELGDLPPEAGGKLATEVLSAIYPRATRAAERLAFQE